MTIPQIATFLAENNLNFLGFELDAAVVGQFHKRFARGAILTDLGLWEIFEGENPSTFAGMYQFWLQRQVK